MELVNLTTKKVIARRLAKADDFFGRLRGLMGRKSMPAGAALVLSPCRMVHTFFMRFSIDVVFLDRAGRVLRVIHEMPPFRVSPYVKEARTAVELPGGSVKDGVRPGDVLIAVR